ncbi:helix-turn-helix domain-containing protein [Nocardia abscessus]|uniref:helix-turn-helix domain-containing protein n=1 Tax=Nocardia abscessus TaxID=120957 RepID=UPI002458FD6A|nr:helix-turn-helix domain-containing protein [Nocardia abscessus]
MRHDEKTGTDDVTIGGIAAFATALTVVGVPRAAQRIRARHDEQHRARPPMRGLAIANTGRSRDAASVQVAGRWILSAMRSPTMPAAIAQLRMRHPEAGLTALGRMAIPPLSKDAVAGRLRRLIATADRHTPRPRAAETP